MDIIDQITFRAPHGSAGVIVQAETSIRDQKESEGWLQRLEPFLRVGGPQGCGYLDFGTRAAFVRWYAERDSELDWQYALVHLGQPAALTGRRALESPDLGAGELYAGNGEAPITLTSPGPGRGAVEAEARSEEALGLLVPLLGHALGGRRRMIMPWTGDDLPKAVMWGLVSILDMLGDKQPVSFLTYASARSYEAATPGLFVCFRPGVSMVPPDPGFEALARDLAERFAADPGELRQRLNALGPGDPADQSGRIARLLALDLKSGAARSGGNATVGTDTEEVAERRVPVSDANTMPFQETEASTTGRPVVTCPICLHEIYDWNGLGYWRWEAGLSEYVELAVPAGLNPIQQARHLRGAYVRCPASADTVHFLPVNYGRFGPPVLLGFVGLTKSGKSHLLASMVGAIENRELEEYGITAHPIDHANHRRFMEEWVDPLLSQNKVLRGTREGIVEFADAFLMSYNGGPQRPVALYDVAGGDLARVEETNQFLWIADGLFFVIDPDHLTARRVGDETFSNVLDVIRESGRPGSVSAAIILNKADKLRFDEPVTHWLRSDSKSVDAVEILRESADIYAYLNTKGGNALAAPYQICDKATLHVASPTGGSGDGEGGVYPRGVTPRRVLRPLVAMLAMTGVLTGADAEQVGI